MRSIAIGTLLSALVLIPVAARTAIGSLSLQPISFSDRCANIGGGLIPGRGAAECFLPTTAAIRH